MPVLILFVLCNSYVARACVTQSGLVKYHAKFKKIVKYLLDVTFSVDELVRISLSCNASGQEHLCFGVFPLEQGRLF